MEKTAAKDRIQYVISSKRINQTKLARLLAVSPAAVNKIINERADGISPNIGSRIKYLWPEFRYEWLMTGEGSIYEIKAFDALEEPLSSYGNHLGGKVKELEGRIEQLEAVKDFLIDDLQELILKLKQTGSDMGLDASKYDRWKLF
jgi:hypothetical protein